MHRLFLCVCEVFLSAGTVSYGCVTSCRTPEEVPVGQQGTINCSFPESIGNKKFIVVRSGPSSTDEERIVNCFIINGVRRCDVSRGYDFTYTTRPLQTVFIPNVTKQHEGTYICQLIPSDPNDCKSCYLKVTEARILDSSQKQDGKARYNGDNDDNETPNRTGSNHTSTLPTGAVAGIVVGALIVAVAVAVAVAVVVVKMRKQTCCKKGGQAPYIPSTIESGVTSSEKGGQTLCISPTPKNDDTLSDSSQESTTPLMTEKIPTV